MTTPPAPPTDARPCTAKDVAATAARPTGAAGGHLFKWINLRNISTSTCVLKGYPRVTASNPGLPDVQSTAGSIADGGVPANMPPGQETTFGLQTDSACSARPGGGFGPGLYHHIAISLSGSGTIDVGGLALDTTCGVHVTNFSVPQPDIQAPDPLGALRVSLELPSTARAGKPLSYVADLTNPTDHAISLSRCPGYLEAASPARTSADNDSGSPMPVVMPTVKLLYLLNCRPVESIGPRRTIRFQIQMALPRDTAAGALTLSWSLISLQAAVASATTEIVTATPAPS